MRLLGLIASAGLIAGALAGGAPRGAFAADSQGSAATPVTPAPTTTQAPTAAKPAATKRAKAASSRPAAAKTPAAKAAGPRAAARADAAKAAAAATTTPAKPPSPRTLDEITIEGEIPVPQVLFITARDQRRFMEFQHHRYQRTSLELGRATATPSRVVVTAPAPAERKEIQR